MGNLIWHEYARFVSITATIYTIWASLFALVYRKFFWDFVNGQIRNPGGIQPAAQDAIFVSIIVKAPILPIISMIMGLGIMSIELPAPFVKGTSIQRSLVLKVVLLLAQAFVAQFFYQGTNGALWSLIAAGCYSRAVFLGEVMKEAKENRGQRGHA